MGNSTSQAAHGGRGEKDPTIRQPSSSSTSPHRSMRTKKKSLELPDLASLSITYSPSATTRGRNGTPAPKSASIPIPYAPEDSGRRRPHQTFSSTDVLVPDPPRGSVPNAYFRGAPRTAQQVQPQHPAEKLRIQQQQRVQELYNQSHAPVPAPPPSPNTSPARPLPVNETVQSSIPIALGKALLPEEELAKVVESAAADNGPAPDLVPVKITWRGGGKSVQLARAGDDDWKGRQIMLRDASPHDSHSATVPLPPGTHHIRFIVDDQWRIADDLPTAVDDQGSLANYVAVPLSYSPPTASPLKPAYTGHSFWSASSSNSTAETEYPSKHPHIAKNSPLSTSHTTQEANWTSTLPLALIEAAREEEAYLQASSLPPASSSHRDRHGHHSDRHSHPHTTGFVPLPNIPPAPSLPRHLDKLILNARPAPAQGTVVGSPAGGMGAVGGAGRTRRRGRDKDKDTASSGTREGKEGKEGRERGELRERNDQRDREQRRTMVPPAPPPSEVGHDAPDLVPSPNPSSPPTPSLSPPPAPPTPSRPLDTTSTPGLADDASVLPVPSHVVLHHLSTSAIRNGVLAVGNTTRYRRKYLTTIYYKPT